MDLRTSAHGRAARIGLAGALVAALTLTLAACSPGMSTGGESGYYGETEPSADMQLHPVGDRGHWLSNAYAAESVTAYGTVNQVCGIFDGTVIEEQRSVNFASRVMARNLSNGAVMWERDALTCGESPVVELGLEPGPSLLVSDQNIGGGWSLIEPTTGADQTALPFTGGPSTASFVTRHEDVTVYQLGLDRLVGVTGDQRVWETKIPDRNVVTPLTDGVIGVEAELEKRALTIDAQTGEQLWAQDLQDHLFGWSWASDGMALQVNASDPEYKFIALDGKEVNRTTGISQYRFVPSASDGVLFSIADHALAGTVVGVDAEGHPALWQGAGAKDFTPSGKISLPDSIIGLEALSADGNLLLITSDDDDELQLLDSGGKLVHSWPTPDELQVIDGYLVMTTGATTTIAVPEA